MFISIDDENTNDESLSEQQQMLALLQSELEGYIHTTPSEFWNDEHLRRDYFNAMAQKLDNLARAAELIGLQGFSFCCDFLVKNFNALAEQPVDHAMQIDIEYWPQRLLAYLQNLRSAGFTEQANQALSFYIAGAFWPCKLDATTLLVLNEYLNNAEFSDFFIENAEATLPRPDALTPTHADLTIAVDVRPELFSALIIELPKQSEIFSHAVESFINSDDAEHLLAAQRIAHTIKGAANVVGVAGLANLMHYAEDLLEKYLHKQESTLLLYADLLLATADCLAEITEYFQGFSAAPNNVMTLLVELLRAQDSDNSLRNDDLLQKAQCSLLSADDADLFDAQELAEVEAALQYMMDETLIDGDDAEVGELSLQSFDSKPFNEYSFNSEPLNSSSSNFSLFNTNSLNAEETSVEPSSDALAYAKQPFSLSISDEAATELLRAASEVKISNFRLMSRVSASKHFLTAAWHHQKKLKHFAESLADQTFTPSHAQDITALLADNEESLKDVELALQEFNAIAVEQKTMVEDLHARAVNIRLLPASQLSTRCARAVRQASNDTQKQALFSVVGGDVCVDSRVLSSIIDPLLHLIRNAIDHGLEHPSVRRQLGKPDQGDIKITYQRIGDALSIAVQDDGAGINYAELQRLAIKRGFLAADKNYSQQELHRVLFMPGFSTRTQVTQLSGRGIGLDVVNAQVKQLRGELNIHSVLGEGTSVVLTLPLSILSAHLLVVRSQQQRLAVMSRGIEQIIYFNPGDLNLGAHTNTFVLQDKTLPVYFLKDIYGFNTSLAPPVNYGALLVVKNANGERCGIAVESLESGENYVIKPLNHYCYKPAGVVGAVILGCGGVAPVVDLNDFTELNAAAQVKAPESSAATINCLKPLILVVDDSLSVRQALSFLLAPLNGEIIVAKDGLDAITQFQTRQPALVITDLEMPRLNGLELARHIRREKNAFDVPIMMLSSRNSNKHRMLAAKAGINAYLTKPWNDEEILATLKLLLPVLFVTQATSFVSRAATLENAEL